VRRRGGQEDTTDRGFLEALSSALGLQGSAPLGPLAFPQRTGAGSNLQTPPFQPSERTKNQELAMLLKQVP
jgi:hypothetical protein